MNDFEKIQGTWVCYQSFFRGQERKKSINSRYIFSGDEYWWEYPTLDLVSYRFRFRLDESKMPKLIDMYDDDGASLGIYRFDSDDRLVLCAINDLDIDEDTKMIRPVDFETSPDSLAWIEFYKRLYRAQL